MYAAEIHVQLYVAIMMQSSFMFFWTVGLHVQFGKNLSWVSATTTVILTPWIQNIMESA